MSFQLYRDINKSFSARVFTYLSAVMITVAGIFTYFNLNSQQTYLENMMLKNGRMITGISANNARLGVFANDKELISESLQTVIDLKGIIGTCVYDTQGHLLQRDALPGWENSAICSPKDIISADFLDRLKTTPEVIHLERNDTVDFWAQILTRPKAFTEEAMFFEDAANNQLLKTDIIGFVAVIYDKNPIKENIRNILVKNVFMLLLFLAVGGIAIYFIIQRLTRPLKNLVTTVQSKETHMPSKDDMGILADSFSDMVQSLQDSFSTANTLQKGLETKVEELRESEEKFRNISEEITNGVAIVQDGKIAWCNTAFAAIFGSQTSDITGQDAATVLPEMDNSSKDTLGDKSTSGHRVATRKKNNQAVHLEINTKKVIFDKQDAAQLVIRDITRQKLAEKEKKELEVKALCHSKLASLGQIAANVAHEINQPLTFIKIAYESIIQDIKKQRFDPEEIKGYCAESLRQIDRITLITQHLRSFGKQDTSLFSHIYLSEVLKNSLILMGENLRLANITVVREIEKNLPPVQGNSVQLEQIFINLFQNSYDALAKSDEKKILISIQQTEGMIELCFADTGPGIATEELNNIFEPFFTTKRLEKRSGLGLGIINNIVKEHNGTIKYQDREGGGAVFIISLPISK